METKDPDLMAMLTQLTETVTQLAVRVDGISGGPRSGEVEVKQAPGESPPVTIHVRRTARLAPN